MILDFGVARMVPTGTDVHMMPHVAERRRPRELLDRKGSRVAGGECAAREDLVKGVRVDRSSGPRERVLRGNASRAGVAARELEPRSVHCDAAEIWDGDEAKIEHVPAGKIVAMDLGQVHNQRTHAEAEFVPFG